MQQTARRQLEASSRNARQQCLWLRSGVGTLGDFNIGNEASGQRRMALRLAMRGASLRSAPISPCGRCQSLGRVQERIAEAWKMAERDAGRAGTS